MPENTVKVSRPSAGGNPFRVGGWYKRGVKVGNFIATYMQALNGHQDGTYTLIENNQQAVEWFKWYATTWTQRIREENLKGMRGKNLACWCKLDQPCHADVLLELANK